MTRKLKPGDRVTFRKGKKHATEFSPGATDLNGVQAVVVDRPSERVGAIDGKTKHRVTVQPILQDGSPGAPLDTPTDNLRREGVRGYVDDAAKTAKTVAGRIFSRGAGAGFKMPHPGRWSSSYDQTRKALVHEDADGERWIRTDGKWEQIE